MGIFSRIFGSGKEDAPSPAAPKEAGPDQIVQMLENKMSEKSSAMIPGMREMHEKISRSCAEFSSSLASFEAATGPDKIDARLLDVSKSYRSSLIKAFNEPLLNASKIDTSNVETFADSFRKFSRSFLQSEAMAMKFVPVLKNVFGKELGRVQKSVDSIESAISDTEKSVSSMESETRPLSDALALSRELASQISKISGSEAELEGIMSSVQASKDRKKSLEDAASALTSSKEWADHISKTSEVARLQGKKGEMESVMLQSIMSIERPMKKLRKAVEDGQEHLDSPEILEMYIDNPLDAFLADPDQSIIRQIASKIRSASINGLIDINEKGAEKMMDRVASVESGALLQSLRRDHDALCEMIARLDAETRSSAVLSENSRLAEELRSVSSDIARLEGEASRSRGVLEKMESRRDDMLSKLSESVRKALGEDIKIDASN